MVFPPGGGFEHLFGATPGPSGSKKEEKGVPWNAKVLDDQYYVPLSQVAELLEANDVLPKVTAGIRRRVNAGPKQKEEKSPASERMADINRGYRRGPND